MKLSTFLSLSITLFFSPSLVLAQIQFSDSSSTLLNVDHTSGVAMGIADMNGDGLDDIVRLENASDLKIDYQQPDGSFTGYSFGNLGNSNEWALCIADVDENGFPDIVAGGAFNGLKFLKANSTGTDYTLSLLPPPLPHSNTIFLQGVNFVDIDNDGSIDLFACNDVGINSPYKNDGAGNFTYDTSLIDTKSALPSNSNDPYSGNYGTTWTDFDWDGDVDMYLSKCRLGVTNATDGRRVNMMMKNDGLGGFAEVADPSGMRPFAQSWASSFADFDNDGDMDAFVVNHDSISQILLNDGTGIFTDITSMSGISTELETVGVGIQVILEDFDNDTYVDIFFTTYNQNAELYRNNGDQTFTEVTGIFENTGETAQSAAAGDLNHDGFLDLILGFAFGFNGPNNNKNDQLQINNGNDNHFIAITLQGVSSNKDGIGSRIEVYGPGFGKLIREVRAGESYGIQNSMTRHVGLGENTIVDSVVVLWTSGVKDKWENLDADQFYTLSEYASCGAPVVRSVKNANNDGPGSLRYLINNSCFGDTIVFSESLIDQSIPIDDSEILIDKKVNIIGLGTNQLTLSQGSAARVFRVGGLGQLILENMNVVSTGGTDATGILNEGEVLINNVRFEKE